MDGLDEVAATQWAEKIPRRHGQHVGGKLVEPVHDGARRAFDETGIVLTARDRHA